MSASSQSQRRKAIQDVQGRKCEECGNHTLDGTVVEGLDVLQCSMCGALSGDDDVINRIELIRDARDAGIDIEVYPLVQALNAIKGVRCRDASGGDDFTRIPPFVRFGIGDNRVKHLEHIATSLELMRRELSHSWRMHVELARDGLCFELAPQIDLQSLDPITINELQSDLAQMAVNIKRDQDLSWWHD